MIWECPNCKRILLLSFVLLAFSFCTPHIAFATIISEGGEVSDDGKTLWLHEPQWVYDAGEWHNFTDYVSVSQSGNDFIVQYGDKEVKVTSYVIEDNNAEIDVAAIRSNIYSQRTCQPCPKGWENCVPVCSIPASPYALTYDVNQKSDTDYEFILNVDGLSATKNYSVLMDVVSSNVDVKYNGNNIYLFNGMRLDFNDLVETGHNIKSDAQGIAISIKDTTKAVLDPQFTTGQYCGNYTGYDNVYINDSAVITVCAFNGTQGSGYIYFQTVNFTVNTASITAYAAGFRAADAGVNVYGNGIGAGEGIGYGKNATTSCGGGGAGFGGIGGNGTDCAGGHWANAGINYSDYFTYQSNWGDNVTKNWMGSGGGAGSSDDGGQGGGGIFVNATYIHIFNATISAIGGNGASASGGGGSGGLIQLFGVMNDMNVTFNVAGGHPIGTSHYYGGSGGGGRIKLYGYRLNNTVAYNISMGYNPVIEADYGTNGTNGTYYTTDVTVPGANTLTIYYKNESIDPPTNLSGVDMIISTSTGTLSYLNQTNYTIVPKYLINGTVNYIRAVYSGMTRYYYPTLINGTDQNMTIYFPSSSVTTLYTFTSSCGAISATNTLFSVYRFINGSNQLVAQYNTGVSNTAPIYLQDDVSYTFNVSSSYGSKQFDYIVSPAVTTIPIDVCAAATGGNYSSAYGIIQKFLWTRNGNVIMPGPYMTNTTNITCVLNSTGNASLTNLTLYGYSSTYANSTLVAYSNVTNSSSNITLVTTIQANASSGRRYTFVCVGSWNYSNSAYTNTISFMTLSTSGGIAGTGSGNADHMFVMALLLFGTIIVVCGYIWVSMNSFTLTILAALFILAAATYIGWFDPYLFTLTLLVVAGIWFIRSGI